MSRLLTAELLKVRTTRTAAAVAATALVLVVVAVGLHGYGLPIDDLARPDRQLDFLVGWGEVLGALFAGLLGALSFTTEIRHGTIRPTLLATPNRRRVIAAKATIAALAGAGLGLTATTTAVVTGRAILAARGIDTVPTTGDVAQLVIGGAAAAGLWAVIGLGLGAIIRSQVPTIVGLLAWVLFVEGILVDTAPAVGRYAPSALGQALGGLHRDTLLAPAAATLLLAVYAVVVLAAATATTTRRDFA